MLRAIYSLGLAVALLGTMAITPVQASEAHPFATAHYVLQVSEADPARWNLAMNNAVVRST